MSHQVKDPDGPKQQRLDQVIVQAWERSILVSKWLTKYISHEITASFINEILRMSFFISSTRNAAAGDRLSFVS
jgi:hypothetical protein